MELKNIMLNEISQDRKTNTTHFLVMSNLKKFPEFREAVSTVVVTEVWDWEGRNRK
jgi:hypothetical protein